MNLWGQARGRFPEWWHMLSQVLSTCPHVILNGANNLVSPQQETLRLAQSDFKRPSSQNSKCTPRQMPAPALFHHEGLES
jgi:hypothetical protein